MRGSSPRMTAWNAYGGQSAKRVPTITRIFIRGGGHGALERRTPKRIAIARLTTLQTYAASRSGSAVTGIPSLRASISRGLFTKLTSV
jgi:hypothetical protein